MFDYIIEKMFFEKSCNEGRLFIAAPLKFREDEQYQEIINCAITSFEEYNCVKIKDYFNTFVLRERKPKLNKSLKKIEDILDKRKEHYKLARKLRNFYEREWWLNACYSVVRNSNAVLYILPKPVVAGETLTQGALCESQVALENRIPVTVYSYEKVDNNGLIKTSEIFQITSLDELFERYQNEEILVAPKKWFKREPKMNISSQWREK